jgi:hypothetical protein
VYLKSLGLSEQLEQVFHALASIIGRHWQEQESLEAGPVARALLSLRKKLHEIERSLSGHRTGFRDRIHIDVTSQVQHALAKDSSLGDLASAARFVDDFVKDAEKMAKHCSYAYHELASQHGPLGRPGLGWYDDFTELLLQLARQAKVKPTITTDRNSGERGGWLLTVARELETFLPEPMRSPTTEALVKRLARAKRNLGQGQKRSAA